jgi:PAS domain S-box-containing protein
MLPDPTRNRHGQIFPPNTSRLLFSMFGRRRGDESESLHVEWEDGERILRRECRQDPNGQRKPALVVRVAAEHPTRANLDRLAHEYGLRDELDGTWAARPRELVQERDHTLLVLEDPGGTPLHLLLAARKLCLGGELGMFLRLAVGATVAVGAVHACGLVHKDLKPANMLVDPETGRVWLMGFGIASCRPRERQPPEPPEVLAGTLPYMSPEQTGRTNRSIDTRSDLYSLGVALFEMLTGTLPFSAGDPMEWVHCHVARQPTPPSQRLAGVCVVPPAISAIILKLLAKTPDDRYQTAGGVEHDLLHCLAQWEARARIDDFRLGEHDVPDRLVIAERLYGRERELQTLVSATERVARTGVPELVLVAGYSGIGKSSLVSELHKTLVPSRALFASGKFDQGKRDIPYSTLAEALQNLIRPLLAKKEVELGGWRDALRDALRANGRLLVDLVPDLGLIVGEQSPLPELSPQDAQRRFQHVFRRFVGVFARPEHPLTLFVDDLQWADLATLELLEDLLTQPEVHHLLVIGAYRHNEVGADHPLRRKLDMLREASAAVTQVMLTPLSRDHLTRWIADSLHEEGGRVAGLACLIDEKTAGNPFFAIQFMSALVDERLLLFEHGKARWSWNPDRIASKGYTENVADLMAGKLNRLPAKTQSALQQLACLGDRANIPTLSVVLGKAGEEVEAALWDAVRLELVERQDGSYRFIHDRVHEAAYKLIPEGSRAEAHLRIGRLLAAETPPERLAETIFEIVNQLNRGAHLITSRDERERLAELNLIAGQRAKTSTAYASALIYLNAGAALLAADSWERRRELILALELHRAECEFLTGEVAKAEERLTMLSSRAATAVELARVACLRVDVYTTLDQSDRAVAACLDYLRHVGIDWSPHPTEEQGRREYQQIWSQLGSRAIEALVNLPLMSDPACLATVDVLTKMSPPALYTDANLLCLAICRAVNLSLERGNGDGSCVAYVMLGMIAGLRFGNYEAGFRFGRLGCELVETRGLKRFQAGTYMSFANLVMPWTKHVRACRDLLRRAFDAANKIGDLTFAAFSCNNINTNLLAAGDSLAEVQHQIENGVEFAQKARFGLVTDIVAAQLELVRTLRGLTPIFGSLNSEQFDESRFEHHLTSNPALAAAECRYWIRKLQARFFAGDYAAALHASSKAQRLLWTSSSFFEEAEYHFYSALSQAGCCDQATAGERQQHLNAVAAHHRKLQVWAKNCPENFENRAALVEAEIARLKGCELDSERLYEQAARSARANGFVHNEALARELAARFYAARGFEINSYAHLRKARQCYESWGADGKVRHLDQVHPHLRDEKPALIATGTIGAPVEHLDLSTVVKVSQAISGEIVPQRLIDTLMRTAVEQSGAERGLLVLLRGTKPQIEAEATSAGDTLILQQRGRTVTAAVLPESVLHYVLRTRESVILGDAATQNPFDADSYIRERKARSILCLPLITQAKLIGVLYLENNLSPHVFAPGRIAVLKLVASQAAISLENSRLYSDLQEREAKIRRLVDANIIGIHIFDLEGRIIEANDAFLRMVGYDREDLVSGRMRWTDLTPPEWRDRNVQVVEEVKMTGSAQPYEKEYFRKNGSRVPVLVGAASFEESGNQGVAFVLDLTERKRAEETFRELESDLAHMNRVSMMGGLAASLAHEITQPIASVHNDARAAQNFLDMQPPDLGEVREALASVVGDVNRAAEIIDRIRAQIKKAPPRKERFDLDAAIDEVMVLARNAIIRNGVSVQTRFADGSFPVQGDRVQLQQVLLNLILNAVEAMGSVETGARELSISTEQDHTGVLVAVRDSGPGIAATHLERVFEAFYTTKSGGTGMGLSICRSIIDAHGGRLWAGANEPRGAVFQFTLPGAEGELTNPLQSVRLG